MKRLASILIAITMMASVMFASAVPAAAKTDFIKYRGSFIVIVTDRQANFYQEPDVNSQLVTAVKTPESGSYFRMIKSDGDFYLAGFFKDDGTSPQFGYMPKADAKKVNKRLETATVLSNGSFNVAFDDEPAPGLYYAEPAKNQTATLTVTDESGNAFINETVKKGGFVFSLADGQSVSIDNGSFRNAKFAPASALIAYLDKQKAAA